MFNDSAVTLLLFGCSFNYHLSRMRQNVERAFGLLVARFGVLWRPLRCEFERIPGLLNALCRLHNFCVLENEPPPLPTSFDIAVGDVRGYMVGDDCTTGATGGYRLADSRRRKHTTDLKESGFARPVGNRFSRTNDEEL
jgi:hypothetical protein